MESKSADIDLIWNSLKHMDLTGKSDAKLPNNAVRKQKRKLQVQAKSRKFLCYPDSVLSSVKHEVPTEFGIWQEKKPQCTENYRLFSPFLTNGNNAGNGFINYRDSTSLTNTANLDSDDEPDQINSLNVLESEFPDRGSRPWTFNLCISAIHSQNLRSKVNALSSLKSTIEGLVEGLPEPPMVSFPPPYDTSTIALTYRQGSIISDLPQGQFVPEWSAWSRTHASALDQFASLSSARKNEPLNQETSSLATPLSFSSSEKIQQFLNTCGVTLFRSFSDSSEKCRHLALECTSMACLYAVDVGRHLPFLMSAVQSRFPVSSLDSYLKIFVTDPDVHERFVRGSAEVRQDKRSNFSRTHEVKVIEISEQCRLLLCKILSSTVRGRVFHGNVSVLGPYFPDIIFVLQSNLQDPFLDVKIESCNLLVQLLRIPQFESVAKIFATPLALAALSNMRNRKAKVRIAAIELFQASVCVPDRDKVKGAGSEAILELVGFREENVLPVASFYDASCAVSINILAELVQDKNSTVRSKCCSMISFFMTCLPDRADFHQRLIPYLLSFFKDSIESTRQLALQTIDICGHQYEAENSDDVVERRQFNVDGDSRCNHISPLPFPFTGRPRLGARLFVRSNTKRFFDALLRELTDWKLVTKIQAAHLLQMLLVYCEEHLTMDISRTLSLLVHGLRNAMDDVDHRFRKEMEDSILDCIELVGRYVNPDTYISIILPRVIGSSDSATSFAEGGIHSNSSRVAHAACLTALIKGSLAEQLVPYLCELLKTLCSPVCFTNSIKNSALTDEFMFCLMVLIEKFTKERILIDPLKVFLQKPEKASQLVSVLQSCSHYLQSGRECLNIQQGRESLQRLSELIMNLNSSS